METSPPGIRGRLGSLQQLAIVSGIFFVPGRRRAAGAPGGRGERGVVAGSASLAVDVLHDGRKPRWSTVCWPHDSRVTALPRCHPPHSGSTQGAHHAGGQKNRGDHQPDPGDHRAKTSRPGGICASRPAVSTASCGLAWRYRSSSSSSASPIFYYSNVLWEAVGYGESKAFLITVIRFRLPTS